MKSRLPRTPTLRNAAWRALPTLALLSAAAQATAAPHRAPATHPGNSHLVGPASSSAKPLALTAGLPTPAPALRVAESKSFGYLQPSRIVNSLLPRKATGGAVSVTPAPSAKHAVTPSATPAKPAAASPAVATPDVIVDNTLGQFQPVTGPAYTLAYSPGSPSSQGALKGTNLFFSFSQFNLATGESATFSGPSTVSEVFVRVTGNTPSTIDGQIACTIPNAGFFFMNPAGVIFTTNASLNLQGSFYLTTSDYIRFTDNSTFAATNPAAGVAGLSSAGPAAFGFLASDAPAGITVTGQTSQNSSGNLVYQPSLHPASGNSLMVVGGDIAIAGGELAATGGGAATIASVGSAAEARLATSSSGGRLDVSAFSRLGNISISGGGFLGSDARNGAAISGPVAVNAASISIDGADSSGDPAELASRSGAGSNQSNESGKSGAVNIDVTASLTLQDGEIETIARGPAAGGNITIAAGSISVGSNGDITANSGLKPGDVAGPGGTVSITAGDVTMQGPNARITAQTYTQSNGGQITMQVAGTLQLNDDAAIATSTFSGGNGGSLTIAAQAITLNSMYASPSEQARIVANTFGTGNGGDINIKMMGGSIDVQQNGDIAANSGVKPGDVAGTGGTISITADAVMMEGPNARITAQTYTQSNGGQITMQVAGALQLNDDAAIATSTFFTGNGGNVAITAQAITLSSPDPAPNKQGRIVANAFGPGRGGNVKLMVMMGSIDVLQNGEISANSGATPGDVSGAGGTISIVADTVSMQGPNARITAQTYSAHDGGQITMQVAGALQLNDDAAIATTTFFVGSGGDVTINAQAITLNSTYPDDPARITARTFGLGPGGTLNISGGTLRVESNGLISANSGQPGTPTDGAGGTALLDFYSIIMSGTQSRIVAQTYSDMMGGNLTVDTHSLIMTGDSAIAASTFNTGKAGNVTVDADSYDLRGNGDNAETNTEPRITSRSFLGGSDSGSGGSVTLRGDEFAMSSGAFISAQATSPIKNIPSGSAGSLDLSMRYSVSVFDSSFSIAAYKAEEGNLNVAAQYQVVLVDADVFGTGHGGNTANITIGYKPGKGISTLQYAVLNKTQVMTSGTRGSGGDVTIYARQALLSGDSMIHAIGLKKISGLPDTDIAAGLIALPTRPESTLLTLSPAPVCAPQLDANFSSFVVTGMGGRPPGPEGWMPDLITADDPPQRRRDR